MSDRFEAEVLETLEELAGTLTRIADALETLAINSSTPLVISEAAPLREEG